MADYNKIKSLFSTEKEYPNYQKKEWYRYEVENPNYAISNDVTIGLNINFKMDRNKFLNYHEGYLLITTQIIYNGAALPQNDTWGLKNSTSIINSCR